jgi:2,4-didehydro-3-deoxy-L-rhamnonate hydrolase
MSEPFPVGNFELGGRRFAGQVSGERVRELPIASTADLLDDWERSAMRIASISAAPEHELASLRVLPPVQPRQILQAGANYRKHVVELVVATGQHSREDAERIMDERARSGRPYLFQGMPTSMCGAYDDVVLPRAGTQHDWELELAVVIGRGARHVPADAALDVVAGYTICNDLTTRDLVLRSDVGAIGADWVSSKCAPTFLPTGPYLVPAALVPDPMGLHVRLSLNGEVMQDESTRDMLYDVARLIAYASDCVQLLPGDLLLTGSPAGNGAQWGRFLAPGDVMRGEITGLGAQQNRCVAEDGYQRAG